MVFVTSLTLVGILGIASVIPYAKLTLAYARRVFASYWGELSSLLLFVNAGAQAKLSAIVVQMKGLLRIPI